VSLLDGRPLAAAIGEQTAEEVSRLAGLGVQPSLAAVVASADPASAWYLRSLARAGDKTGIAMRELALSERDAEGVIGALDELSADASVHGIICLTPLPDGLSLASAAEHIAPGKDVDGASPLGLGRLAAGLPAFAPATPLAVLELLHAAQVELRGAEAVIVGRSTVVGKPLALLLLAEHATVTVCHSATRELALVTRRADVLVAAAGSPHLIGAAHVKEGAVVIDVGTNVSADGALVGDVDTDAVAALAAVSPVPGGVGPVTTAVLLRNVARAAADANRGSSGG